MHKFLNKIQAPLVVFLALNNIFHGTARYLLPEAFIRFLDFLYGPVFIAHQTPRYEQRPWLTFLHLIPGTFLTILGLIQFSTRMRKALPQMHRWLGRVYIAFGILSAGTALTFALLMPFSEFASYGPRLSGLDEMLVIAFFSAFLIVALLKALFNIRKRQVTLHQEWMKRSFALALGITSVRIYYILLTQLIPSLSGADMFSTTLLLGFGSNLLLAEVFIRNSRALSRPAHLPSERQGA